MNSCFWNIFYPSPSCMRTHFLLSLGNPPPQWESVLPSLSANHFPLLYLNITFSCFPCPFTTALTERLAIHSLPIWSQHSHKPAPIPMCGLHWGTFTAAAQSRHLLITNNVPVESKCKIISLKLYNLLNKHCFLPVSPDWNVVNVREPQRNSKILHYDNMLIQFYIRNIKLQ